MHDHSKGKALGFARLKVEHKGNEHELNFVVGLCNILHNIAGDFWVRGRDVM